MTWTNFAVILLLCYVAYYGLNLIYDLVIHKPPQAEEAAQDVLVFQEPETPERVVLEEEKPVAPPAPEPSPAIVCGPVTSTGAVGILQLLNLAKDDLIEYTKAIPY